MPKNVKLSRFVYSQLLTFYPPGLRRRFGAEMADVFEELMREALVRRGPAGIAELWGSTLWELLTVAAVARLENRTLMAGALSFLASSVLFLAFFSTLK